MKVQTLHHDASLFAVARPGAMTPVVRSAAAHLHPLLTERERQRALNAAKLERMFAKPLVASLSAHTDGISAVSRCRTSLAPIVTGSYDGELILWSAAGRTPVLRKLNAHAGVIRGVNTSHDDRTVFSCGGNDRKVFAWKLDLEMFDISVGAVEPELVRGYDSSHGAFGAMDSHWSVHEFVCGSGAVVEVFDPQRGKAKSTLSGVNHEAIVAVKYNASETHLVAASTQGCFVMLFDTRTQGEVSRVQLQGRANSLCWNPREPMNLAMACEDNNAYLFDIRKFSEARTVYKGHVQAVTSVDFSPVGNELVTGSYDKTIRFYRNHEEKAREVYFTKRMQRLAAVCYSGDGQFVFSASEDMNLRIWKTRAHEKLGVVCDREKKAMAYREKLKNKYAVHDQEIRTITKHRYVPKFIKNQGKQRSEMFASRKRKDDNKEKNEKNFVKLNDKQRIVRNAPDVDQ